MVGGDNGAVNPAGAGTKAAAHTRTTVRPGDAAVVRLRLTPAAAADPFTDFDRVVAERAAEADEFYDCLQRDLADADARRVQRQAFAGLIWSKQWYQYDVSAWLAGDPGQPPPPAERARNRDWEHLNNADVIAMPDKWEYPWYAAGTRPS